MQETQVPSLGREDPLEEGMASTPVFLPEKSHDRGAWQATVHGVAKSRTGLRRLSMHTHTNHPKMAASPPYNTQTYC